MTSPIAQTSTTSRTDSWSTDDVDTHAPSLATKSASPPIDVYVIYRSETVRNSEDSTIVSPSVLVGVVDVLVNGDAAIDMAKASWNHHFAIRFVRTDLRETVRLPGDAADWRYGKVFGEWNKTCVNQGGQRVEEGENAVWVEKRGVNFGEGRVEMFKPADDK